MGVVFITLGAAFGSAAPLLVKFAVDALRADASWSTITWYASAVMVVALVQALFRYGQRRLIYDVSRFVETDLRGALYRSLVRQPPAFFDTLPTGDVMSRFSNDTSAVRMLLGPGVMFGTNTVVTLAFAIGLMVWIDVRLTLLALLPLPFVTLAVRVLGRRLHLRSTAAQTALAEVSTSVQENLSGLRVVRAYGREESEEAAFRDRSAAYVDANLALTRIRAILSPLLGFLLGLSVLVILWYGGRRVVEGTLTLGDFVAFTMYLGMIGWPLIAFGWITNLVQRATAAMERINRILLARPSIDDTLAESDARPESGAIAWRDVSFGYGGGRDAVLERFSLEIEAGTTLGMTGPTGGGKTTLTRLLVRLYEPSGGTVEVDGRSVDRYPLAALRRAIAVAPQEPFLFSDTLRANLAIGRAETEGPGRIGLEEAIEIAGMASDVEEMPAGLDTLIGERGITLSGGQKQRAALARAILADPLVLVLDDAFSSVDTETEERILSRLRDFMAERTTILVSHRASTLRAADRIVVLDGGRVIESGTHAELVTRDGWYGALERRQRLEEEIERV